MLARAAAKLAEECLPSGAYGSGNANTNDYKAHAGREGLIGEAVVDAGATGLLHGHWLPLGRGPYAELLCEWRRKDQRSSPPED